MKANYGKRLSAGFMTLLMCANTYQAAAAQSFAGNPQLMQDIGVLNKVSKEYNSKTRNDNKRVDDILGSFESMMGRKLNLAEKAFLSLQFATMKVLPTFEVKGNSIQVFDTEEGAKDLVISVEVLDAEKNTFKFGNRIFHVDPNKPIHENIQHILKELEKGESVSLWQKLNPFAVPQAHASMPTWLKYVLVGAVALVAGIFIGKAIQKNKDKKNAEVAESRGISRGITAEADEDEYENEVAESSNSHEDVSTEESEATPAAVEAIPTTGEDPAVV